MQHLLNDVEILLVQLLDVLKVFAPVFRLRFYILRGLLLDLSLFFVVLVEFLEVFRLVFSYDLVLLFYLLLFAGESWCKTQIKFLLLTTFTIHKIRIFQLVFRFYFLNNSFLQIGKIHPMVTMLVIKLKIRQILVYLR